MIDRLIDFSARRPILVIAPAALAALIGLRSLAALPLDALPDAGDKQVIVYSQWDRSPDLMDSQVTFPIVSALSGAPGVTSARGISDFGASFVYVIFDDDTDLYWARSRTLEYLSAVIPSLPEGVRVELGPDATSLGWIFQYVLRDASGKHSLADLRSYQDWYLTFRLKAVAGVSEIATVGGLVRQYQVNVDPNRLRAYHLTIQRIVQALRNGNSDVGGGVFNGSGGEFMVRGLGQARSAVDLEEVLVSTADDGTPVRIRDVAHVSVGVEPRRGLIDLDGRGEVVSGIVVMRQGENALEVIERVKETIRQIEPTLPAGMHIDAVYDRSDIVRRSIGAMRTTIIEITATVVVVILVFLRHVPSAAVAVVMLPLSVLIAFVPFQLVGIDANVMSLTGVAIAIGALVDAAIVMVEQAYKKLAESRASGPGDRFEVVVAALQQVGRPCFFALLVIAVSFLPVLTLEGEAGRLFKPLAYAKSLAMLVASALAVTLVPAIRLLFMPTNVDGRRPKWLETIIRAFCKPQIAPESSRWLGRWTRRIYEPIVERTLDHKGVVAAGVLTLLAVTALLVPKLGREFLPPFDEGVILYMPSVMPGVSVQEAERLLQSTDRVLAQFPEVDHVLGKAGRANSATDPAPLSMFETVVVLRARDTWRRLPTWYSAWAPDWARGMLGLITPDRSSMTQLVREMDDALRFPGVANAWSMPVRGRLDMLTTGIRTPLGLKVKGNNIEEIGRIGTRLADVLRRVPGTRGVFAEAPADGRFLDVRWNRAALAGAGIGLDDAQAAVRYAIGGENVTTVQDGRERYPVAVRYAEDFRQDTEALKRVLVSDAAGQRQFTIGELAEVRSTSGPTMIRDEDGLLTGYVSIDVERRDLGGYIRDATRAFQSGPAVPPGFSVTWSGQYEAMIATEEQLKFVVPLTLSIIVLLLYLSTRSWARAFFVLLAVPFSAIGAIWAIYLLGYQMSVPVWVGLIALLGIDAETGVLMLLYLDEAYDRARREESSLTPGRLRRAILEGSAGRVRPKLMTAAALFAGLLPIMWSTGPASELMKRVAAPMLGGILTSFLFELLVYPAVYHSWKSTDLNR